MSVQELFSEKKNSAIRKLTKVNQTTSGEGTATHNNTEGTFQFDQGMTKRPVCVTVAE